VQQLRTRDHLSLNFDDARPVGLVLVVGSEPGENAEKLDALVLVAVGVLVACERALEVCVLLVSIDIASNCSPTRSVMRALWSSIDVCRQLAKTAAKATNSRRATSAATSSRPLRREMAGMTRELTVDGALLDRCPAFRAGSSRP
jgi:hypothetical protein